MVVEIGKFYRHFKGGMYQVLNIATDCDTSEKLVIYQALYGTFEVYARPMNSFCEMLNPEKYPNAKQPYRFIEISRDELALNYGKELNAQANAMYGKGEPVVKEVPDLVAENGVKESGKSEMYKEAIAAGVAPVLLMFLEAETSEKKLEIIKSNYMDIDERTLTNIEVSLDIIGSEGTIDERLALVTDNLRTKAQYENMRLR